MEFTDTFCVYKIEQENGTLINHWQKIPIILIFNIWYTCTNQNLPLQQLVVELLRNLELL